MSGAFLRFAAALSVSTVLPAAALAQQPPARELSKWEIQVFGGGLVGLRQPAGSEGDRFPDGTPILAGSTVVSRLVPSWYFGDGAAFLNSVNTRFGVSNIIPLDAALRERLAERGGGASFGFRLTRALSRRIGAEFGFEYARSPLRLTDDSLAAIETTRASFTRAWQGLLGTGATVIRDVSSVAEINEGSTRQIMLTGGVNVGLAALGRFRPHVSFGAGVVLHGSELPGAELTGRYRFDFAGIFPIDETDVLTVRTEARRRAVVALIGGGFTVPFSRRHGVRVDARLLMGPDPIDTVIGTQSTVLTQTPAFSITTGVPGVQFSNNPSIGRQSSLTGPPVSDLRTFEGSGWRTALSLTAGYVFRLGGQFDSPPGQRAARAPARVALDGRKWEVSAHGGFARAGNPTAGDQLDAFPVGQLIATTGPSSRAVSSWYFGDGAALVNQAFTAIGFGPRIEPLDPMLRSNIVRREGGAAFGVRVARDLTSRVAAEFSLDRSSTTLELTEAARSALETASSSFTSVWRALFTSTSTVTSELTVTPGDGSRLTTTGAANIGLVRSPRVRLFATVGAGGMFNRGTAPAATLEGRYVFVIGPALIADERDTVTVQAAQRDRVFVLVLGGGAKFHISARHGVSVDARWHLAHNSTETRVTARPSTLTLSPGTSALLTTTPSLQFSSTPQRRSSLSGPAVDNLTTFTGTGREVQPVITFGYFVRF